MKFSLFNFRHFVVAIVARFRRGEPSKTDSSEELRDYSPIPKSSQEAHARLHHILSQSTTIQKLSHEKFMAGWIAMAYIAPGLNPDEAATEDGGWPPGWKPIAAEAFRRFAKKELTKVELRPSPIRFLW